MTLLFAHATLTFAAAPQPRPEDVAAKKAADAAAGKDIPWAAFCFEDAKVGESASVRVVGVRKRETGCETFGVMLGETWSAVDIALPAVIGAEAWKVLTPAKKDEFESAWIDAVLIPFATPMGSPVVGHASGKTQITRGYLRRNGETGKAAEAQTVFEFDAGGRLLSRTEAWEFDPSISGLATLWWTVGGGKATKLTIVNEPTMPEPIVTCIGNALQRSTWPPESSGTVQYVFGLDRR
jgi:hypothetical protein